MNFLLKNKWDFSLNPPWIPTPHFYRKPHTLLLWIIFGDLITSSKRMGGFPGWHSVTYFIIFFDSLITRNLEAGKGPWTWSSTRWVWNGHPSDLGCNALTPSTHSPLVIFSIHIVPPYFENFKVKRFWPATLCNVLGYNLWKTAWQSK